MTITRHYENIWCGFETRNQINKKNIRQTEYVILPLSLWTCHWGQSTFIRVQSVWQTTGDHKDFRMQDFYLTSLSTQLSCFSSAGWLHSKIINCDLLYSVYSVLLNVYFKSINQSIRHSENQLINRDQAEFICRRKTKKKVKSTFL